MLSHKLKQLVIPQLTWDIAAAYQIILLPLIIFLRHNDYPLRYTESLICIFLVFLVGIFWGMLMYLGGQWGRVLVTTFLLVLLVDIQTGWITTVGLRLLINVVVFGTLSWLLRKRLSQVLSLVFAAMILGTLIQPTGRMFQKQGDFPGQSVSTEPFLLHVILDEYSAPEALDFRFDLGGQVSQEIKSLFLDHGFTLYSRAYSRFCISRNSIPNTLNRGLQKEPAVYWKNGFHEGSLLEKNEWFDHLIDLGYDLHVIQSDYIKFAGPEDKITSTISYNLNTIHSLIGLNLAPGEKVQFIFGTFAQLSWFLDLFHHGYSNVSSGPIGSMLRFPVLDELGSNFSPISTLRAMDELEVMVKQAKQGQAIFAHLLMPHFPYAFENDCTVKSRRSKWLNISSPQMAPDRNDSTSRAIRYPSYLRQIQCTNKRLEFLFEALETAGIWDNALIVIHGDHGSRLTLSQPDYPNVNEMSETDFADAFGTLLAIKFPHGVGHLDRRFIPLTDVFENLFLKKEQTWPPAEYIPTPNILESPWVFLRDGEQILRHTPMPPFAGGAAENELLSGESP